MADTPTYKSTLTGPELDEALRNIGNVLANIEKAAGYAETAEQYGTIVEQNQTAIQAIEDNLPAVQGAATNAQSAEANAQAAAQSAQEAQTAAQQALGFRTFFSAVSPDESGDLDPSRPMTTPTAQESWTIKSKGDRIQSVQIDGFTTQSGTGDPSPTNVREISTAGMWMAAMVFDGSSDENWRAFGGAPGVFFTDVWLPSATNPFNGYASRLIFYNSGNMSQLPQNRYAIQRPTGCIRFIIRVNNTTTDVSNCRVYLSENPVVLWAGVDDKADATGLYIPIQTQGHEYRCQMLELTEPLCDGDKVESNVPSGCDMEITFDGSSDEKWQLNVGSSVATSGSKRFVLALSTAASVNDAYTKAVAYSNLLPNVEPDQTFGASYDNTFSIQGSEVGIRLYGISTVVALRENLSAHPITIRYQSTAYTEANDIPVALETHKMEVRVLDGMEPFSLASSPSNVFQSYSLVGGKNFTVVSNQYKNGGNTWNSMPDFSVLNSGTILGFRDSRFSTAEEFKANLSSQYSAGTPVTIVYELATPAIYAHDPVDLVPVPYTEEDATAAQQLANTPSTLPYFDSADVPMLLNKTTEAEPAAESEPAAEAATETDAEGTTSTEVPPADATNAVQPMTMPAPLSTALPVAGTYVVSSQNGTTVQVSLKSMQDGGDAATLEGMTLDDIKALISSMIADANK